VEEVVLEHVVVLAVVPVTGNDSVLLVPCDVVRTGLGGKDNVGSTETVDVLARVVTVDPEGTLLILLAVVLIYVLTLSEVSIS
jgi:hypothetical protein